MSFDSGPVPQDLEGERRRMNQDAYLTAAEVALLFKVNVETVYDLAGSGCLPATKIGGQWRFDSEEIRDWFRTAAREGRS